MEKQNTLLSQKINKKTQLRYDNNFTALPTWSQHLYITAEIKIDKAAANYDKPQTHSGAFDLRTQKNWTRYLLFNFQFQNLYNIFSTIWHWWNRLDVKGGKFSEHVWKGRYWENWRSIVILLFYPLNVLAGGAYNWFNNKVELWERFYAITWYFFMLSFVFATTKETIEAIVFTTGSIVVFYSCLNIN